MSKKTLEPEKSIQAQLEEKGVPADIAEYAANQSPLAIINTVYAFSIAIVMGLGFLIGAIFLWQPAETLNNKLAASFAENVGALLYRTNFGVSGLIALFAWIFLSCAICGLLPLISKKLLASSFVYGILNDKVTKIKPLRPNISPPQYLRKYFIRSTKFLFFPALFLTLIALLVGFKEINSYSVFGEDKFVIAPILSFSGKQTYSNTDIRSIELGCNHVTGKNRSDKLVYKITFKDGKSLRMEDAQALHGTWLQNAVKIDAGLKENGFEYKRWKWGNRDPLHPDCLTAQRNKHTESEFNQIASLLQIGHFSTDSKYDIGTVQYSAGHYEKAIKNFDAVIQETPNDTNSNVLARLYYDRAEAKHSLASNILPNLSLIHI